MLSKLKKKKIAIDETNKSLMQERNKAFMEE